MSKSYSIEEARERLARFRKNKEELSQFLVGKWVMVNRERSIYFLQRVAADDEKIFTEMEKVCNTVWLVDSFDGPLILTHGKVKWWSSLVDVVEFSGKNPNADEIQMYKMLGVEVILNE